MELLYFILGIFFMIFVQPIVGSIVETIMVRLDAIKNKYTEEIQMRNIKIQQALSEAEDSPAREIGFTAAWGEEEETQENDEVL